MFLFFLDLLEDEASVRNHLSLLLLSLQKDHKEMIFSKSSGFLEEMILTEISVTFRSLLLPPKIPAQPPNTRPNSSYRQLILLKYIEEFLSNGSTSGKRVNPENPFHELHSDLVEAIFQQSIPFSALLSSSSTAEVQQLAKSLLSNLFNYFQQFSSLAADKSKPAAPVTSLTSYPVLSLHFKLMIAFLSSYSSLQSKGKVSNLLTSFQNLFQPFQQNQTISTFILKQIMILLQQYSHYQQFYLPTVPTSSSSSNHSLSRSSSGMLSSSNDENDLNSDSMQKKKFKRTSSANNARVPTSLLQKMYKILQTEKTLIELLQLHSLPNPVKSILLKSLITLSNSFKVFYEIFTNELEGSDGSQESADRMMITLQALKLLLEISFLYSKLFSRNELTADQQQVMIRCLCVLLCSDRSSFRRFSCNQ
jgi:hypothetical protein